MKKVFATLLAIILILSVAVEIIPMIPVMFSSADEVNEHVAFYTSFDGGNVPGETYRGYPMRGVYDLTRFENVSSSVSNDWMMSMVESVDGNEPKITSRGPEKLADGDGDTSYMTETEFPVIVRYSMLEPVNAVFYSITSANNYNANAPMDWTVEGSKNGEDWVVLDTVEGQTFSKRAQTKKYEFENSEYYLYYRIVITKRAGGETSGTIQFSEFVLRENSIASESITSGALAPNVIVGGPLKTYVGQLNLPWKGERSLKVTAKHSGTGRGYSNAYLFRNLDIPVPLCFAVTLRLRSPFHGRLSCPT